MAEEPTIVDVIRAALDAFEFDLHTSTVCRIKSYDPIKQVADCVPVVRRPLENKDGDVQHEEVCVLPNVPVLWRRAGGYFEHYPLAAGDHVLVVFTHENIATWRTTGGVSDPGDRRRHALGSCVAIPGIESMLKPLSPNPLDLAARIAGMCFGEDGTDRQLQWSSSGITGGRSNPIENRVSPVALADRTDARLAALEAQVTTLTAALTALTASVAASTTVLGTTAAAMATHTHSGVTTGAGASGPSVQAAPAAPVAPGGPPAAFVPVPLTTAADILKGTGPLP